MYVPTDFTRRTLMFSISSSTVHHTNVNNPGFVLEMKWDACGLHLSFEGPSKGKSDIREVTLLSANRWTGTSQLQMKPSQYL